MSRQPSPTRPAVYALPKCLMTDPQRYSYHPTVGDSRRLPKPWAHIPVQEPADDLPASLELLEWGGAPMPAPQPARPHAVGDVRDAKADLSQLFGVPPETDEYKALVFKYFRLLRVEADEQRQREARDAAKSRGLDMIAASPDGTGGVDDDDTASPDKMILELCRNFPLMYLPPSSPYSKKREVAEVRHQGFRTRTVDVREQARQTTLSNIGRKPKTKPKSDPDSVLRVPRDPPTVQNPRSPFALVRTPTNPSRADLYKKGKYQKHDIRAMLNKRNEEETDPKALTYTVLNRAVTPPLELPEHLASTAPATAYPPPVRVNRTDRARIVKRRAPVTLRRLQAPHPLATGSAGSPGTPPRMLVQATDEMVPTPLVDVLADQQVRLPSATLSPLPQPAGLPPPLQQQPFHSSPTRLPTRAHQMYKDNVRNTPVTEARATPP